MSDPFSAAGAISRIPGVDPAKTSYRSIGGGLTNRTYLVQTEERHLILRLDAPHTATFGLDRRTELAILEHAANRDLAPAVVFADADAGVLVYEYLSGRSWSASDLESAHNLEALAGLLREVHALPRSGVVFDAAGAVERYVEAIKQRPDLHPFGVQCREIVASIPLPSDPMCCHNDVVAENVLEMHNLRLLDWEYACDNDPLFDLACMIDYHDLSESQTETLLSAYAGTSSAEHRERLDLQLRLFDPIQWLWLAVRQVVIPGDMHGDRLRRIARRIRDR